MLVAKTYAGEEHDVFRVKSLKFLDTLRAPFESCTGGSPYKNDLVCLDGSDSSFPHRSKGRLDECRASLKKSVI